MRRVFVTSSRASFRQIRAQPEPDRTPGRATARDQAIRSGSAPAWSHVTALGAMPQRVVHQHQRQHGLGDRRGADADAGGRRPKVSTVDGWPFRSIERRGCGSNWSALMAMLTVMSCPVEMPPSTPPALLLAKPCGVSSSPCWCRAGRRWRSRRDLDALDRVDAHHRVGDVGVELVEQRLAQAHRHVARRHEEARAAAVAGLAQLVHVGLGRAMSLALAAKNRLPAMCCSPSKGISMSPICVIQPVKRVPNCSFSHFFATAPAPTMGAVRRADERRRRAGRAGRISGSRCSRRGPAEGLDDVAVVPAALVGVADQQADRRAGGLALVHAGGISTVSGSLRWVTWRWCRGGAGRARAGCRPRRAPCRAGSRRSRSRSPARGFAEVGDAEEFAEAAAPKMPCGDSRRPPRRGSVQRRPARRLSSTGQSRM